jgi:hypothetical protein
MMTKLQIALIACASALAISGVFSIYMHIVSRELPPHWTAWMVFLSFTVAGLSFARVWKVGTRKQ